MTKRPVIHLNKSELLRRSQALIRAGQKRAFTAQVKNPVVPRHTPQGKGKPSARFVRAYDPAFKAAERAEKRMRDAGVPSGLEELLIPHDVLLAHAVHITRKHLGLRQDKLVRSVPILDKPKPRHHVVTRRMPEEFKQSLYEQKLWRKMKWYKPEEF